MYGITRSTAGAEARDGRARKGAVQRALEAVGAENLSLLIALALLDGALGWVEARVESELATGDHTFFVGAVEAVERGRDGPALVHVGQGYVPL